MKVGARWLALGRNSKKGARNFLLISTCQSSKWGRNNERGHAILNSDQINCAISIIHKYVYDPFRSDFTLGCSYVGTVYLISSLLIFFFSYAQGLIN